MSMVEVSLIPDTTFHEFRQEIWALPLRKRAKWRGIVQDTSGVAHRVQFVNGELVFKNHSIWVKLVPMTEVQWADCVEYTPGAERKIIRALRAQESGGLKAVEEELSHIVNETATGNHRSKPHRVKVPTGPGEPVRG